MTLTEFGAMVGLLTGIFTVIDRFLTGRPLGTITTDEMLSVQTLRCENVSKHEVLITRISSYPGSIMIARDDSHKGIAEAVIGRKFAAILRPGELRDFPIVVRDGLNSEDSSAWVPFLIVVGWRKTRSVWLPQIPIVMISSAKTLRRLAAANKNKRQGPLTG